MKNRVFFLLIILTIGCNHSTAKDSNTSTVEMNDSLVAEIAGASVNQSDERKLLITKQLEGIDNFTNFQEKLILEKNKPGKTYTANAPDSLLDSYDMLEYQITYLGKLNTSQNKILYVGVLSGTKISPHLNHSLVFYNMQHKKLGNYYISSTPMPKLKGDTIYFKGDPDDCNQTTAISFKDSIPQEIFIKCKGQWGDIYRFVTD